MNTSKGIGTNTTYIVVSIILALAAVTVVGVMNADAGQTTEDQSSVVFDAVATQSVSNMDSPWSAGNDVSSITEVQYSEEDQTQAGQADFQYTGGSSVDNTETAYINMELDGDGQTAMTLESNFEDTGEFTSDNTNIEEVAMRDYDEANVVHSFESLAVQQEDEARVSGVEEGDYVFQVDFEFQAATAPSAGTTDTIMELDADLESSDAPDDEPTEVEGFAYTVTGQ